MMSLQRANLENGFLIHQRVIHLNHNLLDRFQIEEIVGEMNGTTMYFFNEHTLLQYFRRKMDFSGMIGIYRFDI